MGLDVGEKHVGIAITDKNNKIAYPLDVLINDSGIRNKIKEIIIEKNISKIVVGIPLTLKGEAGYQAAKVFGFINKNLKYLGPEVVHYDERFTSKIPQSQFKGGKIKDVDKYSACILLNDYIDNYEK